MLWVEDFLVIRAYLESEDNLMSRRPFYGSSAAAPTAKMDMRAATEPGRAFGQMFANLGKIAADSLEDYRENTRKAEEEKDTQKSVEGFLKRNPQLAKQYFDANDEKEIAVVAKSMAKNGELPKMFASLQGLQNNMRMSQKLEREDAAINRFSERAMGMIPNPKVEEIEAKIADERSQLSNLLIPQKRVNLEYHDLPIKGLLKLSKLV